MHTLPTSRIVKKCPPIEISRYYKELRLQGEAICASYSEDITGSAPSLTMRASALRRHLREIARDRNAVVGDRRKAYRECSVLNDLLTALEVVRNHGRWERERIAAGHPV